MTDTIPPAASPTPLDPSAFAGAPAQLVPALIARGFTELTSVQRAVVDPAYAGRDLRVSSKTGSGKTVALGFLIAPYLAGIAPKAGSTAPATEAEAVLPPDDDAGATETASAAAPATVAVAAPASTAKGGGPRALVLAPTRELAVQVAGELRWLLAGIGANVVVVTGGTSIALERRSLSSRPEVIVGTPGRLLDHLEKGAIDASQVAVVVLDEADQMLDLGFRDDLITILGKTPTSRRTHLVSATFSRAVMSLGAKYQRDPLSAEGTALGSANEDIAHVVHLVRAGEIEAALVNLLLLAEGERVLVFVRTRADTADLAERLVGRGFSARGISGDLEQRDRTRTLDAFRSGALTVLVATDVAARGLDVPDVGMVVHVGPPGDAEALTHRAGRTGRAGRKGVSVILANQAAGEEVQRLLSRARIRADVRPAPNATEVQKAHDETLEQQLKAPPGIGHGRPAADARGAPPRRLRPDGAGLRTARAARGPRGLLTDAAHPGGRGSSERSPQVPRARSHRAWRCDELRRQLQRIQWRLRRRLSGSRRRQPRGRRRPSSPGGLHDLPHHLGRALRGEHAAHPGGRLPTRRGDQQASRRDPSRPGVVDLRHRGEQRGAVLREGGPP